MNDPSNAMAGTEDAPSHQARISRCCLTEAAGAVIGRALQIGRFSMTHVSIDPPGMSTNFGQANHFERSVYR